MASTGQGTQLNSAWVTREGLTPRVEHGTGGEDLASVLNDFWFGAASTGATGALDGVAAAGDVGVGSASGGAGASAVGIDGTGALGSSSAGPGAHADGVEVASVVGAASATGGALAQSDGTSGNTAVGDAGATGDAAPPDPPAPPSLVGGGGGGWRHPPWQSEFPRALAATGVAVGVDARSAVGRSLARGGHAAMGALDGVAVAGTLGQASATGIENPDEADILAILADLALV